MKIEKVFYHFNSMGDDLTGSTITLADGSHINGWFDAKTLTLTRANSLPRDKRDRQANYRQRDLDSAAGKQLVAAFRAYAVKHYAGALEAHNAARAEAEHKRLAQVEAEQKAHRDAAVAVLSKACGYDLRTCGTVVDVLIREGFIARDGRSL